MQALLQTLKDLLVVLAAYFAGQREQQSTDQKNNAEEVLDDVQKAKAAARRADAMSPADKLRWLDSQGFLRHSDADNPQR